MLRVYKRCRATTCLHLCCARLRSLCAEICRNLPVLGRLLLRTAKSRLAIAIAVSLVVVFCCSQFMSYTLFHYFKIFDDYTHKLGDDSTTKLLVRQNYDRLRLAHSYLKDFNASAWKEDFNRLLQPGPDKDLVITVITIDRIQSSSSSRPEYFTQTVAKLLRELRQYYSDEVDGRLSEPLGRKLKIELMFCAVDILPFINREVEFIEETTSVETLKRFTYGHPAPPGYIQLTNRFQREKEDYVYCMNSSFHHLAHRSRNPGYLLLLEDDAPPITGYFTILEDLIRNRLDDNEYGRGGSYSQRSRAAENRDSTLYVKLFHPNNLLEFHSLAAERIPQLLSVAFLLSLVGWFLYACFLRSSRRPNKQVLGQLFVYFVFLCVVIGRPNVVFHYQNLMLKAFGFLTLVPAPSCCTPAILYPDSAVPVVANYLNKAVCYEKHAKDVILDELRSQTYGRRSWLVQPNLHSHVGQFSVVRHQDNGNFRHFMGLEY